MDCRLLLVTVTVIAPIFHITECYEFSQDRKRNTDIFHLLLGLYKLKPLQSSKIYKRFSENILERGDKISYPTNTDSGENFDLHQYINVLDRVNAVSQPKIRRNHNSFIEKPEYDIENINTENFDIDVILQNNFADKLQKYADHAHDKETGDSFSSLINSLGGNTLNLNDNIYVTKSLPVDDSIVSNIMIDCGQYPENTLSNLRNVKESNGYTHKPIAQVLNNIPAAVPSDNVMNADVIVL